MIDYHDASWCITIDQLLLIINNINIDLLVSFLLHLHLHHLSLILAWFPTGKKLVQLSPTSPPTSDQIQQGRRLIKAGHRVSSTEEVISHD